MKRAVVVGHTGQDGTYLSRLLKEKGYDVTGISRAGLFEGLSVPLRPFSVESFEHVSALARSLQPSEIYYLAAVHQSSGRAHVPEGDLFQRSLDINVKALVNFLEAIRLHAPQARLFYAASSHIFGDPLDAPQDENTALNPNCIYGISKAAGVRACRFYRDTHAVFASVGILYNHESPLREQGYVSQKIVQTAVAIKLKTDDKLVLGSLDARIDWGFAPDYMEAVWRLMQLPDSGDFVISSGETHSIQDFVEGVFDYLGLDWRRYVRVDPSLITKKPKQGLFGNSRKINTATGWLPVTTFSDLIRHMTDAEVARRGVLKPDLEV